MTPTPTKNSNTNSTYRVNNNRKRISDMVKEHELNKSNNENRCKISFSWNSILNRIHTSFLSTSNSYPKYTIRLHDLGTLTEEDNIDKIYQFLIFDYLYDIMSKGTNDISHIWNNRTFDHRNMIFMSFVELFRTFHSYEKYDAYEISLRIDKMWFNKNQLFLNLFAKHNVNENNYNYHRRVASLYNKYNNLIDFQSNLIDVLQRLIKTAFAEVVETNDVKVRIILK